MIEWIKQPWPWYIAGPLIGLTVPALLITGNKTFGISSSLRHICAACLPANIPFFKYNWKKEIWNLVFVAGIAAGGFIAMYWLTTGTPSINPKLAADLSNYGISDHSGMVPAELFSWDSFLSIKGFLLIAAGGFLIGFGTRYAGGCTSGHAIMGLSNLQFPSLVATVSFMAGGFIMANVIFPFILKL